MPNQNTRVEQVTLRWVAPAVILLAILALVGLRIGWKALGDAQGTGVWLSGGVEDSGL